jgi:uncharacterized protein involved in exopolysaccharide biosynthesis
MNSETPVRMAGPAAGFEDPFARTLSLLWGRRWTIAAATVAGLAAAILFLHLATPRHAAYLQLVPTEQSAAALSRNISGLASLAGIDLPRGQASQFGLALEVMKGRDVAEQIAGDERLMRRLFPAAWDATRQEWRQPSDALRPLKSFVKGILALPDVAWTRPGAADVQRYLDKFLTLEEDQKRSIATVALQHPDPILARDLLAALYTATDAHLRARSDGRTDAYVAYLSEKLMQVTLAEHREALASALAEQERVLMMVRSGQPFAADPLGSVTVSDRPIWPSALLALVIGGGAGLALGIAVALALAAWHRPARLEPD